LPLHNGHRTAAAGPPAAGEETSMAAEIDAVINQIKQSLELLRRHL